MQGNKQHLNFFAICFPLENCEFRLVRENSGWNSDGVRLTMGVTCVLESIDLLMAFQDIGDVQGWKFGMSLGVITE